MPVKPNKLLDLAPGVGSVACTFEYPVISRDTRQVLGQVTPLNRPSWSIDTNGNTKRTLGNLMIPQEQLDPFDLFRSALQPTMVLEDGTSWEMGVFYFGLRHRHYSTGQSVYESEMVDGDGLLDRSLRNTFYVGIGGSISDAMVQLANASALVWRDIPDSGATMGPDPGVWKSGTPRKQVMQDLAPYAGWLPPHFTSDGTFVCRPTPNLVECVPDHTHTLLGGRIIRDTFVDSVDLMAPNVHIVRNNGPTGNEIIGEARVDASLDWSVEKRGEEIVEFHDVQGVTDSAAAQRLAEQYAKEAAHAYRSVEYDTPPDPRHDMFHVVNLDGDNLREVSCSMTLQPGANMHHVLAGTGFTNG